MLGARRSERRRQRTCTPWPTFPENPTELRGLEPVFNIIVIRSAIVTEIVIDLMYSLVFLIGSC